MNGLTQVYVGLLDEGVDVWRPVQAEHLHDNIYRIVDQLYDRGSETWQFEPGSEVVCEMTEASDGPILAAVRLHDS